MRYILIDLDGTITNSKRGITKSIQYALKSMEINVDDLDTLCKHIGPPLKDGFMEYYGFDEEEADFAVKMYREYYKDTGIYENEVYEGMEELLSNLKNAGKKLIVATSKPEVFARRILEHFHLADYFEDICGATLDGKRSKKEEVILYALEKNRIRNYSEVVMIGDRKYDIEGARCFKLASIGVLYGFGGREELIKAGAEQIVASVDALYDVIMNMR